MARPGPRTVREYSLAFKLTAVRLSQQPGLQVQAVAAALEIHPFMLSRWRRQVREGALRGPGRELRPVPVREIRRLQELERAHALRRPRRPAAAERCPLDGMGTALDAA